MTDVLDSEGNIYHSYAFYVCVCVRVRVCVCESACVVDSQFSCQLMPTVAKPQTDSQFEALT